ncbi:putative ribonuclease H-like domain-containing protein [Tanacetum coccineum]
MIEQLKNFLAFEPHAMSTSSNKGLASFYKWILDLGATHHMSYLMSQFISLNLNSSKSIVAANGDTMPLEGIGSVDTPSVALSDVYYIPSLNMNLASVNKIYDYGCDVNFFVSDCSRYDRKTHEVVGKASTRVLGKLDAHDISDCSGCRLAKFSALPFSNSVSFSIAPFDLTSCTDTPQQNGVAERKHRHVVETTRSFLLVADVPSVFWEKQFLQPHIPLIASVHRLHEPESYKEAICDPLWQVAMSEELAALHQTRIWDLAPHAWCEKFATIVTSLGFVSSHHDSTLFVKQSSAGRILLSLYVDDLIITGDDCVGIESLKLELAHHFAMKDLGLLHYFMGIEVASSPKGYLLSQSKYIDGDPLPDLTPTTVHWAVVLQILRYLRGTQFQTLLFPSTSALDMQTRSSTEAEYHAMAVTISEIVWWVLSVGIERGFLSQKGSEVGKGVKEKNLNKNTMNNALGIGVSTESDDTMNEDTLVGVASAVKNGVTQSVIDITVEMEKQSSLENTTVLGSFPPLSTLVTSSVGNAPSKSSYANVTGKPSGKKRNIRTLFTSGGNGIVVVVPVESIRAISERFANISYGFFLGEASGIPCYAMLENGLWFIWNNPLILKKWHPGDNLSKEDVSTVPVWVKLHGVPVTAFSEDGLSGRSSYARVMIELRADVELKDNIAIAMPKITREVHYICNVHVEYEWKPPKCASCKVFGHIHEECPKNTEYRPVPKKPTANSSGNKKKGVEPTIEGYFKWILFMNVDNSSTGTTVIDKIEKFEELLTSGQAILVDEARNPLKKVEFSERVGFGTQTLLEQWRDSYGNGDYDDDPYNDDMYEGQDLSQELQAICDNLDIRVRCRKKK